MVVIEPEETEEEIKVAPPKPKTAPERGSTPSTSSVGPSGDVSDGFETASERGVSDDEDEEGKGIPLNDAATATDNQQPGEDRVLNDDELKQEAIEESNAAKLEGNRLFGEGKYEEALLKYDAALQLSEGVASVGELRAICYSNRGVCFLKLGKYEDTIKECTKALELNPSYLKALARRGEAREKLENFEEAIADMKKILELDPSNEQANKAIRRLEPLAAEKRERMKEETIAKLKDMGNSLLGRFGMSLDNFKTVQDPNTGSYSISFQK